LENLDMEVDWKCLYNIPDGGDSLLTSVPTKGDWTFYDENDNTVGEFNYSLAYPVDENDTSKFTTIIPRLKVNIEEGTEEKIESIQVRWYRYDNTTNEYTLMDPAILEQTYDEWGISITDFSNEPRVDELIMGKSNFSETEIPVSKDWYLYDRERKNHATGIYIQLFVNGYSAFYANRE